MNILKRIFGISSSEKNLPIDENETAEKRSLKNGTVKTQYEVPEDILTEIEQYDIIEITNRITQKRAENIEKQKSNYNKAIELVGKDKYNEASELTQKDVLGYYDFYVMAESEEKKGNLKRACEIYWFNIFHNGTDAPANYNRLMILLRKIEKYELELKIAQIYCNFTSGNEIEKINKRIETITKKINK